MDISMAMIVPNKNKGFRRISRFAVVMKRGHSVNINKPVFAGDDGNQPDNHPDKNEGRHGLVIQTSWIQYPSWTTSLLTLASHFSLIVSSFE
jgi:hypothetical protein